MIVLYLIHDRASCGREVEAIRSHDGIQHTILGEAFCWKYFGQSLPRGVEQRRLAAGVYSRQEKCELADWSRE